MGKMYKNKTVIIRSPKNKEHTYVMLSTSILKLDGYQRAIMLEILSNSDDFVINKNVIEKRLGFPHKKFLDAWKSLEEMYFITSERFFGGVKWVINESPYYSKYKSITTVKNNSKDTRVPTVKRPKNGSEMNVGCISDTSIINTDIINTGIYLINNKKTNNNLTTLDLESLEGESELDGKQTDRLISAKAEITLSDPGDTPVILKPDVSLSKNKKKSNTSNLDFKFDAMDIDNEDLLDMSNFTDMDSGHKQKIQVINLKKNI